MASANELKELAHSRNLAIRSYLDDRNGLDREIQLLAEK